MPCAEILPRRGLSFLFLASNIACFTPQVSITAVHHGLLELPQGRKLVLLAGTGSRAVRETLTRELAAQVRKTGYFMLTDRSRDGAPPVIGETQAEGVVHDSLSTDEAIGVCLDATDQQSECRTSTPCVASARITLIASVFANNGRLLVRQQPFAAEAETLERATAQAVGAFLAAVTPVETTRYAILDDSDAGQKRIIALAVKGNIARAREDLRYYVEQDPVNAAALYNLAVLTEALNGCGDALGFYDRALALRSDPRYVETRSVCALHAQKNE